MQRSSRDRHGRGIRGPLLPAQLPGARTRVQRFDAAVLHAVEDLTSRWPGPINAIEFAVDDVPAVRVPDYLSASDAVLDGTVKLSRYFPPGVDKRGEPIKARIVLYRRPIEMRCPVRSDLPLLIAAVLTEQLSALFGDGESPDE